MKMHMNETWSQLGLVFRGQILGCNSCPYSIILNLISEKKRQLSNVHGGRGLNIKRTRKFALWIKQRSRNIDTPLFFFFLLFFFFNCNMNKRVVDTKRNINSNWTRDICQIEIVCQERTGPIELCTRNELDCWRMCQERTDSHFVVPGKNWTIR